MPSPVLTLLKEITLNLGSPNDLVYVAAKQYDVLARKVKIKLIFNDAPWVIPSGLGGVIRYIKPDQTRGMYDTDDDGNPAIVITPGVNAANPGDVTITLAKQVLTTKGTIKIEVSLYSAAAEKLTTFAFPLVVEEAALSDIPFYESEDYFNFRSDMATIQQLNDAFATATQAAISGVLTIDNTLSIAGAIADAKAAGDMIQVSETEPSETSNILWIKEAEEEVVVPTWEDINNIVADEYDSTKTYVIGDYAIYDGLLYKCITAIEMAEVWDNSKWEQAVVCEEISELKSAIQYNETRFVLLNGFDKDDIQETKGYWNNSGVFVATNLYVACNKYARVKEGVKYSLWHGNGTASLWNYITYYDADKNAIGGYNFSSSNVLTMPSGVYFVRLSLQADKINLIFCEGETYPGYFHYGYTLSSDITLPELEELEINVDQIQNLYSTKLLNGFNSNNVTDGGYWNPDNGVTLISNSGYHACNDYVEVHGSTSYSFWNALTPVVSLLWQSVSWYDINKAYISGLLNKTSNVVQSPQNARYARISFSKDKTYAMFVEGDSAPTSYTTKTYQIVIASNYDLPLPGSTSKLNGIKIDVIGDSWSAVNNTADTKYTNLLSINDGADVSVVAVSGCGYFNDGSANGEFYEQANLIRTDADVIFVFGSFNDISKIVDNDVTIGNITDQNTTTICGCINTTITNIVTRNPSAKIIIASPGAWQGYNANNDGNNTNNPIALQYAEAIKNVCYQRGYQFVDLLRTLNLKPWITAFREAYQPDGCHPNNAGHEKYLYPVIKSIIESVV